LSGLPRISIRVDGAMTPAACVELARAAEASGLAGVWFAENAFARGILPAAAACALATRKLRVNAGVFNPYSRHPTMMAMEAGALDELSGGRTAISIGAGIMSATEKMGLRADKPVAALRDTIAIVRGLLCGNEVDHAGPFFSARNVKLDYKPRVDIPIFLAGRGDLTVKLSGEAADGLIVSNMCSIEFAGRLAVLMQSTRRSAGRSEAGEVVQYMPCAVHRNARDAMEAAKMAVADMLPRFWALGQKLGSAKEALLAGTRISDEEFSGAAARLYAGDNPADVLDDRYAAAFSLAGTPESCIALAREYRNAGVTELALTFSGPNAVEQITAVGEAFARSSR
jgi:5,10-methylenetetrahydromethanopterin reductase